MTGPTLPRFYLRHDLPDDTARYAYHRDLIDGAAKRDAWDRSDPAAGWSWSAVWDNGTDDAGPCDVEWSGDWLISTDPIAELTRRRPGPRRRDGWSKRPAAEYGGPAPGDPAKLHAAAPEQPEPEWVQHYAEHDAEHACWQCRQFTAHYEPRYVEGDEVVEHQDLTGFELLPGGTPPAIDTSAWRYPPRAMPGRGAFSSDEVKLSHPEWTVDDPSVTAVFGRTAEHLMRGRLTGLRSAVGAALAGHPRVTNFHDWHDSNRSGCKGFSVRVRVPWETHRTRTEHVKDTPRSRKTHPVQRDVWAIEKDLQIEVPDAVMASNLADAIAGWDDVVERQLARFFPYGDVAACDHCEGRGYVARPGGG